ncbi:DUF5319 domain-containing protein [Corynebacterium sp. A21]|uniref:DUF5319 domain-containing protein n=1 Tax=Corynebacterium sp. A21 TaxID=3457318 RepID=UPI003FD46F91
MNFDAQMPRDPFADDPNDPASFLDAEEPMTPLTEEEREGIIQDLHLVTRFREILTPRGIRGIFFLCEDCEINHYYDWEILATNMRATLANELSPVHEPGAEPEISAYVPWDYCLGYLDGMEQR